MEKVNVGIVELGWAASGHLAAFKQNSRVRVSAVCTSKHPEEVASSWIGEAKVYSAYEEFLEHPELDVVDICTPHHLHAAQSIQAARAGKHLMIEKPMAVELGELPAMRDAIEKAG